MNDQQDAQNIKVWDWSIRVFHWSLPLVIFALWYTRLDTENHMLFAQLLMVLLFYRIIWGFIGTPYARFRHFLPRPKAVWQYLTAFFSKNKPLYLSHNPLGGLMVLVLLGALGFQLMTGLFIDDFLFPGPLYDQVSRSTSGWMTDWHHIFFDYLLALIALHLLAILVYKLRGEGLVKAMLTGQKKPAKKPADLLQQEPLRFPWLRFLVALTLAVLPVIWLFYWF
ncbi:Cytochrome b [Marinospirillum celere]|uniref:Cytochrome b n=1 Tax=Marinospirillum celere TaxID=1122252 RepID=A0A1I1ERL5_9GAMM|nr:cytochrome b/b6 domain-containing protein [Marinospirillum celere]SFB89312.1 Cytochrome b [Marinospirillum celere]